MRWMRPLSGDIPFVRSYPLASFGHVQNFEQTPPDKYVRWVNVTHALVCGLSGSRSVCAVLMRSASCRYPVCIRWCPFNLSCERSTAGQVKKFPRRVQRAHSVFVQRTFCPFLIQYLFVLSVIHLLHVRLLTVHYPLLVWYICAPYDFRYDLHSIRDDFHHWINSFCIFFVPSASVTFIRLYVTAPIGLRLNISRKYYDFGLNSYRIMNILRFFHIKH